MAKVETSLQIKPNDGSSDNKLIIPGGGDIYLQLSRGFNSIINRYRVDILPPDGSGGWVPAKDPAFAEGRIPAPGQPTEVLIKLGPPASLQGRRIILLVGGIALPPDTAGQVDAVIGIYQLKPDGVSYRRVDWEADSAHDVKELISRFEITIT
jgi:hypothetical protein